MAFQTVEEFLNHRGSEGSGSKKLKSWAKEKGFLNFWLHTKQLPTAVWYHRIPELVIRTDKDDPTRTLRNVWGRQHACWEDESILKKQRFRTADGYREHPPKSCGLCRLAEAIREAIIAKEMKDTDVVFEFTGSDKPEENVHLHAGGFTSLWKRDLEKADVERLAASGIYASKVWSETALAKLNYVFVGVVHDDPASGVQVAIQTQLLGDKVKKLINDEIASKPGNLGNPFLSPYCIQFLYRPEEKKFDEKYHARRFDKYAITPEIERLITGDRPDLSRYLDRFNQAEVLAALEKRATPVAKKLPWDKLWSPSDPVVDAMRAAEPARTRVQVPETVAAPAALTEEWGDPCEPPCGAPMKKGQAVCGKCGARYEDAPEPATAGDATVAAAIYDDEIPF